MQTVFETNDVRITVTVHRKEDCWFGIYMPEGACHAEYRIVTKDYDKAMSMNVGTNDLVFATKMVMTFAHGEWQKIERMREKARWHHAKKAGRFMKFIEGSPSVARVQIKLKIERRNRPCETP